MLSPFTYFGNLAPDGGEGREKESAMHWGLPEESTEGLMDLLASLLEVSVARQVLEGSLLEQTSMGEAQRQILGSKKDSRCWPLLHTICRQGWI